MKSFESGKSSDRFGLTVLNRWLDGGRRHPMLWFSLTFAGSLLVAGCGKDTSTSSSTADVKAQPAAYRQMSPQQYLRQVFDRYRRAESYHDMAVARLSYTSGSQTETKLAPLQVSYDRDQLFVQAYDIQILSDAKGLMAWIRDPQTNNFDGQVLQTEPLRQRPTVQWIFQDPILRELVAAGLAGPPPQLEWLFSTDPMKQLFRPEHRFSFGNAEIIDHRRCRSVKVRADSEDYQFWIDEDSGIIRRIDFPEVVATAVSGQASLRMQLTMDLLAATFDAPTQALNANPLPPEPRYVTQLVPLPPLEPTENIGKQPEKFTAKTRDGRIAVTDHGSDREATILIRYAGDEQSMLFVVAMQQWHSHVPENLLTKFRVIVLSPPELAGRLAQQISLPIAVDQDDQIARALDLAPAALAIQDSFGRIAWVQSDLSQTGIARLGAIVADVIQGIDVPGRLRHQWQQQQDAYEQALKRVAVSR